MQRRPWPRSGVAGAAVRLVGLLGIASVVIVVFAIPLGLLTHASISRAVSLGFYLVGAFLVVIGFAGGSRGPFRPEADDHGGIKLGRTLRRASLEELNDTISLAALVVVIGLVLLVIGVAVDSRYTLV